MIGWMQKDPKNEKRNKEKAMKLCVHNQIYSSSLNVLTVTTVIIKDLMLNEKI